MMKAYRSKVSVMLVVALLALVAFACAGRMANTTDSRIEALMVACANALSQLPEVKQQATKLGRTPEDQAARLCHAAETIIEAGETELQPAPTATVLTTGGLAGAAGAAP